MRRLDNLLVPTPEAIAEAGSPKAKARLVNRGVDLGRGLKRAGDFSRREIPEEIHIAEQSDDAVIVVEDRQGLSVLGSTYGLEEAFDKIETEEIAPAPEDWTSIRPEDVVTDREMAEAWGIPVDVVRDVNQEHDIYQAANAKKKAKVMPRAEEKSKVRKGGETPLISSKGVKDAARAIGHAISGARNTVRPSEALARESRRRAAEIAKEDLAVAELNEVFGADYAVREDDGSEVIDVFTLCEEQSRDVIATMGATDDLERELIEDGGFHIVKINPIRYRSLGGSTQDEL
jgi:hypothetical protein